MGSNQRKIELDKRITWCIVNPRRACAARVTIVVLCVCLFVRLFVCLSASILTLQATRRLMSDTSSFSATRAGAETTAFERYGVKTS